MKKKKPTDEKFAGERTPPPVDVREARDVLKRMRDVIEHLPERAQERGEEFFDGVVDKTEKIVATIEQKGYATPGQQIALENMLAAVRKWDHGDD